MLARTWVVPNVEASLWLALAVYRTLVLGYAVVVVAWHWVSYEHPLVAWLALGGMAIWTGVLAVDLGVACVAILLTLFVVSAEHRQSAPTLPTFWASASMLAWAVRFGAVGGATAAAAAERERLARSIHDSVLQVLAWVQRRGSEIGGEAADLGRLAGEQERALRALVARGVPPASGAQGPAQSAGRETDLGLLLSMTVADRSCATFAGPATPVLLGTYVARETQAAVAETLDNVRRHAGEGTQAWVLLKEVDGQVTVTVRDDGAGMAPGRLASARDAGRLGVAQSIVGRLRAMGGDASVTSTLGQGTEVELRLPGSEEAR